MRLRARFDRYDSGATCGSEQGKHAGVGAHIHKHIAWFQRTLQIGAQCRLPASSEEQPLGKHIVLASAEPEAAHTNCWQA